MAKVIINQEICIGCKYCVDLCPKSFKMNGRKAEVIKRLVGKLSCEKEVAEDCPVGAIEILD